MRRPLRAPSWIALFALAFLLVTYLIASGAWASQQPDPGLVRLAVRATLYAMPTPTAQVVEVTRVIEVTRVVEVTRMVEVTRVADAVRAPAALTAPATLTPTLAATATPEPVSVAADVSAALAPAPAPVAAPQAEAQPSAPPASSSECPAESGNSYRTIPVAGGGASHPDTQHGDLNLALRGYAPVNAGLSLVEINGPADGDAPQLHGMFADDRVPAFSAAFQVRDWNWSCGEHGCPGDPLGGVETSLLGVATAPGEEIRIPSRNAEIYGGGYKALVLYADAGRLTLGYTREDSVANGYAVHMEELCVDPNLLAAYRSANAAGRGELPALRNGEPVGTAPYGRIAVAIRDRGHFADPRSRKDWWQGK